MSDDQDHPRFELVRLDQLPYAHAPFKCRHSARFDADDQIDPAVGSHWMDQNVARGQRFFDAMSERDFAACPYHKADWRRIEESASEVLSLGPDDDGFYRTSCEVILKQRRVRKREQLLLLSLFDEPIDWTPGCVHVHNGQHRICALRAVGVEVCVVRTA